MNKPELSAMSSIGLEKNTLIYGSSASTLSALTILKPAIEGIVVSILESVTNPVSSDFIVIFNRLSLSFLVKPTRSKW